MLSKHTADATLLPRMKGNAYLTHYCPSEDRVRLPTWWGHWNHICNSLTLCSVPVLVRVWVHIRVTLRMFS